MQQEYRYLLELLSVFLQGREAKAAPEVNWQDMLRLSQIHSVTGILGYMSMQYSLCHDETLKASLRQSCMQTMMLQTQRAAQMQQLVGQMDHAGIDHILMKGYVLREYYPIPELRTYSDIDFVIRPEDREKTHALMQEMGFQTEIDWGPVYSYRRGNEYYEIHCEIMEVDIAEKTNCKPYFQQFWDHARCTEGHTYCFTPEFHFLYLIAHIAKHVQSAGAGIRMYMDIGAYILHFKDTLDWAYIFRTLQTLQLDTFAYTVLAAVEAWFGIPCPMEYPHPDSRILEAFLPFTMEAGLFGKFDREAAISTLKREPASNGRFRTLMKRAFPPADTIKTRYTYLQDKPWLLPAAWIHRWFKTRDKLGTHAHEAYVLMTADDLEVQRLQQIMQDIGL